MRIAVIGGSGFVGRHVVRDLLGAACSVVNIDQSPAPKGLESGEEMVVADMMEPGRPEAIAKELRSSGKAIDGVIWLAASIRHRTGVDETAIDDLTLMVDAPLRLLRALEPAPAAFVNLSSVQVYGRPMRLPVEEDHPKAPFTAYGVAKLHAEHMLDIAGAKRRTAVSSLRVAFIYGPGQHPANALPRFLDGVRRGVAPTIHGPGSDVRDDIYVGDVARAARLAIERRARGAFNVASGKPHTLLDVARAACALGTPGLVPQHDDQPSGWVDRWYSAERAHEAFGFTAAMSFADGVRAMWDEGAAL